ncbi:MAG: hypothetical protein EOO54_16530 [Haliea sp.]|nr:MAG: hypothetical protein EOO54_16530 [Haliea sp.]
MPGYAFESWLALVVPAGVNPLIVAKLNAEVKKIVDSEGTQQLFAKNGITPGVLSSAESQQVVNADYERMGRLVKESGGIVD